MKRGRSSWLKIENSKTSATSKWSSAGHLLNYQLEIKTRLRPCLLSEVFKDGGEEKFALNLSAFHVEMK